MEYRECDFWKLCSTDENYVLQGDKADLCDRNECPISESTGSDTKTPEEWEYAVYAAMNMHEAYDEDPKKFLAYFANKTTGWSEAEMIAYIEKTRPEVKVRQR